ALLPRGEGGDDVAAELPGARFARFRSVEHDDAGFEIDVAPAQIRGLAEAEAFAREDSVEDAPLEGHLAAGQELRLFGGIEERLRAAGADTRQEVGRQRIPIEDLAGVAGQRENAAHGLRIVPSRRVGEVLRE